MRPAAHSVARAASKVPGYWNVDGRFLLVCAKWSPLYPMGHPCVRLSISVLTKERLGCELSSKINLGFTVSIGRYIGSGMCHAKKIYLRTDQL